MHIEPTDNIKDIKAAFGKMVKTYHPEVYPEKYEEIYKAYKQALSYAKIVGKRNEKDNLIDNQVSISNYVLNDNRGYEHLEKSDNKKFDFSQIEFKNNNADVKMTGDAKATYDFERIFSEAQIQKRNQDSIAVIKEMDIIALWKLKNFFILKQPIKLKFFLNSSEFLIRIEKEDFALQVYDYFVNYKHLNKKSWKEAVIPEMQKWASIWYGYPLSNKFQELCGKVKKVKEAPRKMKYPFPDFMFVIIIFVVIALFVIGYVIAFNLFKDACNFIN